MVSRLLLLVLAGSVACNNPCGRSPSTCRDAAEEPGLGTHTLEAYRDPTPQQVEVEATEAELLYTDADGNVWRVRYRRP